MLCAGSAEQPSVPPLQPVTVHVEPDIASAVAVGVAVALPVASRRIARHVILRPVFGAAIAATAVTFKRITLYGTTPVARTLKATVNPNPKVSRCPTITAVTLVVRRLPVVLCLAHAAIGASQKKFARRISLHLVRHREALIAVEDRDGARPAGHAAGV